MRLDILDEGLSSNERAVEQLENSHEYFKNSVYNSLEYHDRDNRALSKKIDKIKHQNDSIQKKFLLAKKTVPEYYEIFIYG